MKEICGVYKITIGDDFYIGASDTVFSRYNSHLYGLKRNKHKNKLMQDAYNKNNAEKTHFCILEQTLDLLEREKHYINLLNPTLNICKPIIGNKKKGATPGFDLRNYRRNRIIKILNDFNSRTGYITYIVDDLAKKYHVSKSTIYSYIRNSK